MMEGLKGRMGFRKFLSSPSFYISIIGPLEMGIMVANCGWLLRYYVGVYDPETGSVDVYPSPLVHIRRQVRRLKEKEIPEKASTGSVCPPVPTLKALPSRDRGKLT